MISTTLNSGSELHTSSTRDTAQLIVSGLESQHNANDVCMQNPALEPTYEIYDKLDQLFRSSQFRQRVVSLHSGAVRIPTEIYDEMGDIGVDPRWDPFVEFGEYLSKSFPTV
jgi:Gly-Xaa carboxypeptidase